MKTAAYWIKKFELKPHPEGGYFSRTYLSNIPIKKLILGKETHHFALSSIYFLLETDNFSTFHRLQIDEVWHFYTGNPIDIFYISSQGVLKQEVLGKTNFQVIVPSQTWLAARIIGKGEKLSVSNKK